MAGVSNGDAPDAATAAIEGELRFLDPAVYTSPPLLGRLLHPEFRSFGSSGRAWTRESYIDELREWGPAAGSPGTVTRMTARPLAPDLVLITFDIDVNARRAHRSSLWRRTEEAGWQLYFTQGTGFTPGDMDAPS
ncbi:nuclear transport factor 2 family protein [Streptomyces fuscigenes]|uniref:nuclear transport factor 2 family protein n=1 Tax=Streptomyces fuscigenes TaxID=1528880 RepID=UPI001F204BAE|nr:nuclear transport factor 2 family protein [Streptomyces fuscigenes]MCF3962964.1 nuclear transport factor 2 family protein [Streptomyces fuscigenes]